MRERIEAVPKGETRMCFEFTVFLPFNVKSLFDQARS